MKKTILSLAIALVAFSASAQISKGTIMLGGASNLDFTSVDNKDGGDYSTFNIDLKGGYFLIDNLAIGLNLGYYKFNSSSDVLDYNETTIGLFGRYYVKGKVFLGLGFNSLKSEDYSASSIPVELGYAIFINEAVAIEPALNYTKFGGDADGSSFGLKAGISVYLGRNK